MDFPWSALQRYFLILSQRIGESAGKISTEYQRCVDYPMLSRLTYLDFVHLAELVVEDRQQRESEFGWSMNRGWDHTCSKVEDIIKALFPISLDKTFGVAEDLRRNFVKSLEHQHYPLAFERTLTARYLSSVHNVRLEWTVDLRDHLKLNRGGSVLMVFGQHLYLRLFIW
jgi:hypothetical protein